jgi:hypothetical protein
MRPPVKPEESEFLLRSNLPPPEEEEKISDEELRR